jgi:hypothetical protein
VYPLRLKPSSSSQRTQGGRDFADDSVHILDHWSDEMNAQRRLSLTPV